jgi:hypothetical protein
LNGANTGCTPTFSTTHDFEATAADGRQGWLKIRVDFSCAGLSHPPVLEVHEVGCKGTDVVSNVCTSDSAPLTQTLTTITESRIRQGYFRVRFGEHLTQWLKHEDVDGSLMIQAIEALPNVGEVEMLSYTNPVRHGGKIWHFRLLKQGGEQYDVQVSGWDEVADTERLEPIDVPAGSVVVEEPGAGADWLLDPVGLELFRQPADKPGAAVMINGLAAECSDDAWCSFSHNAVHTPTISDVAVLESSNGGAPLVAADGIIRVKFGHLVKVIGTNFARCSLYIHRLSCCHIRSHGIACACDQIEHLSGVRSLTITTFWCCHQLKAANTELISVQSSTSTGVYPPTVRFGASACTVEAFSSTLVKCRMVHTQAGDYTFVVISHAGGESTASLEKARYVPSIATVGDAATGSLKVPVTGGSVLEIVGSGFSLELADNAITVGGERCLVIAAAYDRVSCITPGARWSGSPPTERSSGEISTASAATAIDVGLFSNMWGAAGAPSHAVSWDWEMTPSLDSFAPVQFSAAITTSFAATGDFSAYMGADKEGGCMHSAAFISPAGVRDCVELVLTDGEARCTSLRGEPFPMDAQASSVLRLRLCSFDGAQAYVFNAGAAAGLTIDLALRITDVSPKAGSFAGGTVITIEGAGFADAQDRHVLTGLTRQYTEASNIVSIQTDTRDVSCQILTANFNTLTCLTGRFTSGTMVADDTDSGHHGHSGGGINGKLVFAVNAIGVLGFGGDNASQEPTHVLKSAASGVVVEEDLSNIPEPVYRLSDAAVLEEKGFALAWLNSFRKKTTLCVNQALQDAAQIHAEELSTTGTLSHLGANGKTPGVRLSGHGYAWQNVYESIAFLPSQSGAMVVLNWQDNLDDKVNMEDESYSEVGIGLADGYFVVLYAKPKVDLIREQEKWGVIPLIEAENLGTLCSSCKGRGKPDPGDRTITSNDYTAVCGVGEGVTPPYTSYSSGQYCQCAEGLMVVQWRGHMRYGDHTNGISYKNAPKGDYCVPRKHPNDVLEEEPKRTCAEIVSGGAAAVGQRNRRSTSTPLNTTFKFAVELPSINGISIATVNTLGRTLSLEVADVTTRFVANDLGHLKLHQDNRWYTGQVEGYFHSRVTLGVRANGDVHGSIQLMRKKGDATTVIEVAPSSHAGLSTATVRLASADDTVELRDVRPGFGFDENEEDEEGKEEEHSTDGARNNESNSRRVRSTKNTCNVFIDADKWFYDQWGGEGATSVRVERTILAMLDNMLAAMDVFVVNFAESNGPFIYVVGARVHSGEDFGIVDPNIASNPDAALGAYRTFLSDDATKTPRHRAPSDAKGNAVCLNHLFTHANFGQVVGLAGLGTACSKSFQNTAFTSTQSSGGIMSTAGRQSTTTHEIGHNFNAEHDCSDDGEQCEAFIASSPDVDIEAECLAPDDHFIMFPSVSAGANAHKFSSCSKYLIQNFREKMNCLANPPANTVTTASPSTTMPESTATTATTVPVTTEEWYHKYQDSGTFVGEFDFTEANTPHVTSITPSSGVSAERVTIVGSGLGLTTNVLFGDHECTNLSAESDTVKCDPPTIAAGRYQVRVVTPDGLAAHPLSRTEELTYISILRLREVTPAMGSMAGGTLVAVHGNGFGTDLNRVKIQIGSRSAVVIAVTDTVIQVITPRFESVDAIAPASVMISVLAGDNSSGENFGQLLKVTHSTLRTAPVANCLACIVPSVLKQATDGENAATPKHVWTPDWYTVMSSTCSNSGGSGACSFVYSRAKTPVLTNVSPAAGLAMGDDIMITGSGLKPASGSELQVVIGGAACSIDLGTWTDSNATCTLGATMAGTHQLFVTVPGQGVAQSVGVNVSLSGSVSAIDPEVGSYGGGDVVQLKGSGFGDTASTTVSFCGMPCTVSQSSYGSLTCKTSALHSAESFAAFKNLEYTPFGPTSDSSIDTIANKNLPGRAASAFDGNYISEYVSGGKPGTCFVGIDVGEGRKAVLNRVRYFPVATVQPVGQQYASPGGFAMKGGRIEGSNSVGGDWSTLATIVTPHQGWNWLDIKSRNAFRYLRYKGSDTSHCHVTEMEWIGVIVRSSGTCTATVVTHNRTPHPSLGAGMITAPHRFTSDTTFVYTATRTPIVHSMEPRFGSSLGGTTVTIRGVRFPTTTSNAEVLVNGLPCTVSSSTANEIECVTTKRSGFVPPSVVVRHLTPTSNGKGWSGASVVATNVRFFRFLDRWSEVNTWLYGALLFLEHFLLRMFVLLKHWFIYLLA